MHFRTDFTGRDIPEAEDDWNDLPACDLAALLTVDGMLNHEGAARAEYIRTQLAIVRSNLMEARIEHQFVRYERAASAADEAGVDIELDDTRAGLIAACRAELEKRGFDLEALDALADAAQADMDSAPPSA
jgi:uncharacterized protein (DUF3084 family)